MSVKIDRYDLKFEQSPKIIVFDNKLQRNICSVNTLDRDNNVLLATILLNELNTGNYEEDIMELDEGENL